MTAFDIVKCFWKEPQESQRDTTCVSCRSLRPSNSCDLRRLDICAVPFSKTAQFDPICKSLSEKSWVFQVSETLFAPQAKLVLSWHHILSSTCTTERRRRYSVCFNRSCGWMNSRDWSPSSCRPWISVLDVGWCWLHRFLMIFGYLFDIVWSFLCWRSNIKLYEVCVTDVSVGFGLWIFWRPTMAGAIPCWSTWATRAVVPLPYVEFFGSRVLGFKKMRTQQTDLTTALRWLQG